MIELFKAILNPDYGSKECEKITKIAIGVIVVFLIIGSMFLGYGIYCFNKTEIENEPSFFTGILFVYTGCNIIFMSLWSIAYYNFVKKENSNKHARLKKFFYYVWAVLFTIINIAILGLSIITEKAKISISLKNIGAYLFVFFNILFLGCLGIYTTTCVILKNNQNQGILNYGSLILFATLLIILAINVFFLKIFFKWKKIQTDEQIGIKNDLNSLWLLCITACTIIVNIFSLPKPWNSITSSLNGIFAVCLAIDRFVVAYRKDHFMSSKSDEGLKVTNYHYDFLSEREKTVYNFLYQGCIEYKSVIKIPPIMEDACDRAIYAFQNDHPENFWVDDNIIKKPHINGYIKAITFSIPNDAESMLKAVENTANSILKGISGNEKEMIEKIYKYLITNTRYDSSIPDNRNVYNVLIDKETGYLGLTKTFLYLCNKAGIYCGRVNGEINGKSNGKVKHAWNFVRVKEQFSWIDVTMGVPHCDKSYNETDTINYDYFCNSDEDFLPGRILANDERYSDYKTYMNFPYPKCVDISTRTIL